MPTSTLMHVSFNDYVDLSSHRGPSQSREPAMSHRSEQTNEVPAVEESPATYDRDRDVLLVKLQAMQRQIDNQTREFLTRDRAYQSQLYELRLHIKALQFNQSVQDSTAGACEINSCTKWASDVSESLISLDVKGPKPRSPANEGGSDKSQSVTLNSDNTRNTTRTRETTRASEDLRHLVER